jgi:hypothetical protein
MNALFFSAAPGQIFLPFEKVDRDRRRVWGIAQTEDPDHQGDQVSYEASKKAFMAWAKTVGNVREMHQPIAAGSVVKVIPDDRNRRILVGVHVSKGAPDTWEKVLDGTLKGFSIGGKVLESSRVYLESLGKQVRRITDYVLDELSLVDSPANGKCLITAVTKRGNRLVANADVLGKVSGAAMSISDVLSLRGAKTMGAPLAKRRTKVASLVKFTQTLADDDEVLAIRKSDIIGRDPHGGGYLLKAGTLASQPIKKQDLADDGYADAADDVNDDTDSVDLGSHAKNALAMHNDLHKLNGDEASADCDQCAQGDEQFANGNGGGDVQMARNRKGKGAITKRDGAADMSPEIKKLIEDQGNLIKSFGSVLDAIREKGGIAGVDLSKIMPRKEGAVIEKSGVEAGGGSPLDTVAGRGVVNGVKVEDVDAALAPLEARAKALIAKMSRGIKLTTDEIVEKDQLVDEIGRLKSARIPVPARH